jgi:catechol 2,3-dioxygenase-like lactoylglutathione lyase family enzyme
MLAHDAQDAPTPLDVAPALRRPANPSSIDAHNVAARWPAKKDLEMPDLGLTHVALSVHDLDASIAFYEKYAGMAVVHRRAREGVRSAWLTDHTRPFVIVLVEAPDQHDPPLGPFGHLGVACASREEIDRLYAEACREGRPTRAPFDAGEQIGYVARIADPDGHSLELSFGQEVGLAVEAAAKG